MGWGVRSSLTEALQAAEAAAEGPAQAAAEGAAAGAQGEAERPLPQRGGAVAASARGAGPRGRRGRLDVTGVTASVFLLRLGFPAKLQTSIRRKTNKKIYIFAAPIVKHPA